MSENAPQSIFTYITTQEAMYSLPIEITDGWTWNMPTHVKTTILYKHGQLVNGKGEFDLTNNITKPILNLQYRAEGFDVKDITLFVEGPKNYFKSLIIKKYHEQWARKNHIDTTIDEMVESYVDFGGALLKKTKDVAPEVVPLQSLAFCDQTDILNGPIGIRHFYSPAELMAKGKVGWGSKANGASLTLEETIILSRNQKKEAQNNTISTTPGKYVEVFEVHGEFPETFLDETGDDQKYTRQMHIVCFYQGADGNKQGITLFKSPEKKSPFKFVKRDPIYGRALGFGGAEELFDEQVGANSDRMRKEDFLDSASKTIILSEDPTFTKKNNLKRMSNLQIADVAQGSKVYQMDTFPRNMGLFDKATQERVSNARTMGSAQEAIMGEQPPSGTPLGSVQIQQAENHSTHDYRKGKLSTFWDEVEQDWIIPNLLNEVSDGVEFMADLSLKEAKYILDALLECEAEKKMKADVLAGRMIDPAEVEGYKEIVRGNFRKQGSRHVFGILKKEFDDADVVVQTNIAGKQKYLTQEVGKLVQLAQMLIPQGMNPMDNHGFVDLLNQIIEKSGLNPVDFTDFQPSAQPQQQPQPQQPQAAMPQQAQMTPPQPTYA